MLLIYGCILAATKISCSCFSMYVKVSFEEEICTLFEAVIEIVWHKTAWFSCWPTSLWSQFELKYTLELAIQQTLRLDIFCNNYLPHSFPYRDINVWKFITAFLPSLMHMFSDIVYAWYCPYEETIVEVRSIVLNECTSTDEYFSKYLVRCPPYEFIKSKLIKRLANGTKLWRKDIAILWRPTRRIVRLMRSFREQDQKQILWH